MPMYFQVKHITMRPSVVWLLSALTHKLRLTALIYLTTTGGEVKSIATLGLIVDSVLIFASPQTSDRKNFGEQTLRLLLLVIVEDIHFLTLRPDRTTTRERR